jgi:hypothetical protein
MKYIIYVMVQPSLLKIVDPDGYYQNTISRDVLEILNIRGVEEEHLTMEDAIAEINSKKDLLKWLNLTILPVISINWEGEVC